MTGPGTASGPTSAAARPRSAGAGSTTVAGTTTAGGGHPHPRWDASLYADNTAHHRRFDDSVLDGIDVPADARVLDLGCGVGDFTRRLADVVPDGAVLGVDAAPDMVRVAASRCDRRNVDFRTVPAQRLDSMAAESSYDAVVSVATLHWIPAADQPGVLAQIRRILRPGGLFRAEFGGAGQISAVRALLDEEARAAGGGTAPWFFPDAHTYRRLLESAGLSTRDGWVRLVHQRRSVPDADALLGWLRSQVLVGYDPVVPEDARDAFRRRAESRAVAELRRVDGSFDQDYVRLDLRAHRTGEPASAGGAGTNSPAV